MVRLKADPTVGGASYGGQEYPLARGCIVVPEEAVKELGCGWGFTLAARQPAPEQAPEESAPEGKSKK